jgi:CelD/BcsL family acetyltransferase involved in cellulose biosynthesis
MWHGHSAISRGKLKLPNIRKILGRVRDRLGGDAEGIGRSDEVPFTPFEHAGLSVRCHVEWPGEGSALRNAWEKLLGAVPNTTVFQSPTWQAAGWTATHPVARLRVLTIERNGELLGVVPLCLTDKRGLVSPSPAVSDYLEPPLEPDAAEDCLAAVLAFLAAHWDRTVVELTFHNVRESASIRGTLPALAERAGFTCDQKVVEHAPAIALPKTFEAYLGQLDAHQRKELRRKLNNAQTKGPAELVACPVAKAQPSLHRVLDWMEAGPSEKAQAVRQFVRPLMESAGLGLMREGRMELLMLRIESQPAAGLIQFPSAAGPMLYNIGYDARLKQWSPGVVATALAIRRAIEHGHSTYDLLRGREEHKYRLAAVDRALYRLTLKRL